MATSQGPKDVTFRFKLRGVPTAVTNPVLRVQPPVGPVQLVQGSGITPVATGTAPDGAAADAGTYTATVVLNARGRWAVQAFADGGITSAIAYYECPDVIPAPTP